jgi:hypothetical protein
MVQRMRRMPRSGTFIQLRMSRQGGRRGRNMVRAVPGSADEIRVVVDYLAKYLEDRRGTTASPIQSGALNQEQPIC